MMACRLFGTTPLSETMFTYFKPLGTNVNEIWTWIKFSNKKMNLKLSYAKCRPFVMAWRNCRLADDILKCVWLKETIYILIQISTQLPTGCHLSWRSGTFSSILVRNIGFITMQWTQWTVDRWRPYRTFHTDPTSVRKMDLLRWCTAW